VKSGLSTAGPDQPKLRRTALFVVDIGFAIIALATAGGGDGEAIADSDEKGSPR
jgi:hypothetical protein